MALLQWLAIDFAAIEKPATSRSMRNDLGLLAEEYDPRARRQLGNFPQAFSHIGLINTAVNFARAKQGQQLP
jgi:GH15 family glucan-1,4-alpha-glucosidase